jgi:1-acyl-sn-glycerol-3-phosphate acyltransferase
MSRISSVWFRYVLRHAERIPDTACLVVGNHSGIGIADVLCLLGAWTERFDGRRRAVGMMHKMFVDAPVVGTIARGFGAVQAHPDTARAAIAKGHVVACFPGGDLDSCRPFHEARRVHFGPRRGYARLALSTGVPIVPIATIGSHYTYLLLPGGAFIARVTGMKRWARCERFPLVLAAVLTLVVAALVLAQVLPWWSLGLAAIATLVPNPVRVTSEVLPPIDVCAATAHLASPEARVEAAHELVHGAIARAVATMRHGAGAQALERASIASRR